jgi:hypothetical protein
MSGIVRVIPMPDGHTHNRTYLCLSLFCLHPRLSVIKRYVSGSCLIEIFSQILSCQLLCLCKSLFVVRLIRDFWYNLNISYDIGLVDNKD